MAKFLEETDGNIVFRQKKRDTQVLIKVPRV